MIIAIPLDEDKKSVCQTFARAPFFLIYDGDTKAWKLPANPAAGAQGGAGLKAAQFVVDSSAGAVVTVRCGENAGEVFKAAGVAVYKAQGGDAMENAAALTAGNLEPLTHFHAGFQGRA